MGVPGPNTSVTPASFRPASSSEDRLADENQGVPERAVLPEAVDDLRKERVVCTREDRNSRYVPLDGSTDDLSGGVV